MNRVLTLTCLLIFLALPVHAQIEHITIKVDGLACAFCAYGLEKQLKKIEGISQVEISIDEGRAELRTQAGKAVDLDAIEPAIRQSGYTPREIKIQVIGTYQEWNGHPTLVLEGDGHKFLLDRTDTLRKLTEAIASAGKGREVSIVGKLRRGQPSGHHGHPPTLVIEAFQVR